MRNIYSADESRASVSEKERVRKKLFSIIVQCTGYRVYHKRFFPRKTNKLIRIRWVLNPAVNRSCNSSLNCENCCFYHLLLENNEKEGSFHLIVIRYYTLYIDDGVKIKFSKVVQVWF